MSAEQLPLIPQRATRSRRKRPAASSLPVAQVALIVPVPHLDRPFDYEVPQALSDAAVPGARVRVRLAGRLVDGFVLRRLASSEHALQPIRSVHGRPVLTDRVARLCREVADHYAGTLADVLRFAVPPRHAAAERDWAAAQDAPAPAQGAPAPREDAPAAGGDAPAPVGNSQVSALDAPAPAIRAGRVGSASPNSPGRDSPGPGPGWARYQGGAELRDGLGGAEPVRALWLAGPGESVPDRVADLVAAVRARGRGVLVVVPDAAEVARMVAACARHPDTGPQAVLTAEEGPAARYRSFLDVLAGRCQVVVGTRTAVFAPVADLGAIVVCDDGDDSLAEPQAPGWHAREVAALRSVAEDASLVLAGPAATLEATRMAESGWLRRVMLPREAVRAVMPRVQVAADLSADPARSGLARIPSVALEALREGVATGPVLVGVPRTGYLPVLACQSCREQVRCTRCGAALQVRDARREPLCAQHGPVVHWRCPICGGDRLRAAVVGVARTAEEFGRALPGVPVLSSSGERPLRSLTRRALVVATPGAEPVPGPDGYAALVVLDVDASLSRPGLRSAEQALRRWFLAAALVRPASSGGRVLLVGQPAAREVQALVRWDPIGYAVRELDERRSLHLPPAVRTARLVGPPRDAAELADELCDELGARVLRRSGPLPVTSPPPSAPQGPAGRGDSRGGGDPGRPSGSGGLGDPGPGTGDDGQVAWLLAVSLRDGAAMAAALRRAQSVRSTRRAAVVAVRVDPVQLPAAP